MSTNDIWTCCKSGSTNTIALCPEKCPVCGHTKCAYCKIGRSTSLQGVHKWKNHPFEQEGVGERGDDDGEGVLGDNDGDIDGEEIELGVDDESVSVIWEAEDVV